MIDQNHKMFLTYLTCLVIVGSVVETRSETRVAVAYLISQKVIGSVMFTEVEGGIQVTGSITGLEAGYYGFHVHELGDTITCDATGAHFDPDDNNHGGRDHDVRHVGDLGNVQFVGNSNGIAMINFTDSVISLRGRNSILGRAIVLHEQEDDLGLGENQASLNTGNAGPRVACGVIGIRSPSDPWNSSTTILPSLSILIIAFVFLVLSKP